jgi:hypothetical protein
VPSRVFLHVGLPKSGTTFLQAVLLNNKRLLKDAGLLFPGADGWKSQVRAVRDVREMPHVRYNHRREVPGSWDQLAEEMRDWSGDSVVSMEWLSRVEPDQLQRILDTLDPREVHVIFTIRDLARVLPASYQESVLNRRQWTWQEFLAEQSDEDLPGEERGFWRLHDINALIERWAIAIPAERIHVVTVPPRGAPAVALWERFAQVLGVAQVAVDLEDVRRNDGLGLASTEVMRRVNIRSREDKISSTVHRKLLTHQLAKQGLSQLDRGQRPTIPQELHPWVLTRAEGQVEGLKASGVDLVGDLDDLRPDLSTHLEQPPEPETEAMLEVALTGLIVMTKQRAEAERKAEAAAARTTKEIRRLERRYRKLETRHTAALNRWQTRPVRSAVGVLARRSTLLVRVVRRVRRGRNERANG